MNTSSASVERDEAHDLATLQSEVAALRAEVKSLRQLVGALLGDESAPALALRVASLAVVGEAANGEIPRFQINLSIEESGGALHFLDSQAGESARQAALMTTEEGTSLALCGPDGVPRAVLCAREEGGGASFLGGGELAAEIFGAQEAAWLMLNHDGTPRAISVATAQGGNLELFGEATQPLVVLPAGQDKLHSPE